MSHNITLEKKEIWCLVLLEVINIPLSFMVYVFLAFIVGTNMGAFRTSASLDPYTTVSLYALVLALFISFIAIIGLLKTRRFVWFATVLLPWLPSLFLWAAFKNVI